MAGICLEPVWTYAYQDLLRVSGQYRHCSRFYPAVMDTTNLNDIVKQQRAATPDELVILFKDYVCATTCARVIRLMEPAEVKRLLALHLFDLNVVQHGKNRGLVMHHLGVVLGVSKTTLYRWFPANAYKHLQED